MTSEVYAQEAGQKASQRANPFNKYSNISREAYEKLLLEADGLIKGGNPADAYSLLEPFDFDHSGDERFDYLIGIAALDSGKPDKATLALERVLMVNPNSAAARLDIARAYYQLGDMPRAKAEFTIALNQNPSETTRATIDRYLEEITVRESGKLMHLSGYVEGTVGHDSNVNNSTSQSQIIVGGINVTLDPTNVEASDNYYLLSAGGEVTHSMNPKWNLYAGVDLQQRDYRIQNSFDALNLDARVGLAYGAKADNLRIAILGNYYTLGNARNSNTSGINAEWIHVLSPANQIKVFGQYAQYRYIDPVMQPNDFNQQLLGGGWTHVSEDGRSLLTGSLYHGTENDVSIMITAATPDGGRADGPSQFNGLRFAWQMAVGDRTNLFANAGLHVEHYNNINTDFLVKRSDHYYDLTVGANWQWNKFWALRPQLNYSKNDSNIVIYSFSRMDVSLNIRRDFR